MQTLFEEQSAKINKDHSTLKTTTKKKIKVSVASDKV